MQKKSAMTSNFERVIREYLDGYAELDNAFALKYQSESKSIEQCCQYIMGEAKKLATGGCAALTDDEVYGLAVHYYDEDTIEYTPAQANVISNHFADLSDAEKEEAHRQALAEYQSECKATLAKQENERREKEAKKRKEEAQKRAEREAEWESRQISIFDAL